MKDASEAKIEISQVLGSENNSIRTILLANLKAVEVYLFEEEFLQALGLLNEWLPQACEMGTEIELLGQVLLFKCCRGLKLHCD